MGFNSGFKGLITREFALQIFGKYSKIKFHKDQSSGNRVVPFRWTDRSTDRDGDMAKLIAPFRDIENALKLVRLCKLN